MLTSAPSEGSKTENTASEGLYCANVPIKTQLLAADTASTASRRMVLPPAKLTLSERITNLKAASIKCGNYHTLVLCSDGQLYTFGSNCHGQLGVGDMKRRVGPQKVDMPLASKVVQVITIAINHMQSIIQMHLEFRSRLEPTTQ